MSWSDWRRVRGGGRVYVGYVATGAGCFEEGVECRYWCVSGSPALAGGAGRVQWRQCVVSLSSPHVRRAVQAVVVAWGSKGVRHSVNEEHWV